MLDRPDRPVTIATRPLFEVAVQFYKHVASSALMLRCIDLDFRTIKTHRTKLQNPHFMGNDENLVEQIENRFLNIAMVS